MKDELKFDAFMKHLRNNMLNQNLNLITIACDVVKEIKKRDNETKVFYVNEALEENLNKFSQ
ncbi:CLUMA_CG016737, isoform A [Clunio marinus]|uniref:CLUMA_CG016737, isoform A n=1 Tax=Clunio marinus TaxID=568069 RepID=A0A1J1IV01_9DIPT|nr:CLUMA_CG016737, isoform A [Clunio marinus]